MWNSKAVERALLRWQKWRQSVISQWVELDDELSQLSLDRLKLKARQELRKLDFPSSLWLELYWICCVASDYNFDYEGSFEDIVVPNWLPLPFATSLNIEPGLRMYAPAIYSEGDIEYLASHSGSWILLADIEHHPEVMGWCGMFISCHHEFYSFLSKSKGRPKRSSKIGRRPCYSDRRAVMCATLQDRYGVWYVKIAERFDLPIRQYYFTAQSDPVIHLIRRGRKLIREYVEDLDKYKSRIVLPD